jgi:hypothetical protein
MNTNTGRKFKTSLILHDNPLFLSSESNKIKIKEKSKE